MPFVSSMYSIKQNHVIAWNLYSTQPSLFLLHIAAARSGSLYMYCISLDFWVLVFFFCWQSRFIALTVTIPIDLLNHDGARSLWLEAATVLLVTYLGTLECKLFPRHGKWNLKGNGYLSEKKFINRYNFLLPNDRWFLSLVSNE